MDIDKMFYDDFGITKEQGKEIVRRIEEAELKETGRFCLDNNYKVVLDIIVERLKDICEKNDGSHDELIGKQIGDIPLSWRGAHFDTKTGAVGIHFHVPKLILSEDDFSFLKGLYLLTDGINIDSNGEDISIDFGFYGFGEYVGEAVQNGYNN